ncbi:nucleotidyltransferase family protein, partial [Candidatus Bathyarchaeota archaeon]|nr:nucleotidyltransferase family protein [Candidatus Bathyarchaeota archaeon]
MEHPHTAVILAGGEGVRLRPITQDLPKVLVKVGGKPLLQWVIEWLRENRVDHIVIGVAYLKEQIIEYFGNGSNFGVDITYSHHSVQGGTGEGFKLAITRYVQDNTFIALNGDQVTNIRLDSMIRTHANTDAIATIAVVHPRLPFGLVNIDPHNRCRGFLEKPVLTDRYISTGVYVFDKRITKHLPDQGDLERSTFPKLTRNQKLSAYKHPGSFITVNSLRELEEAEKSIL